MTKSKLRDRNKSKFIGLKNKARIIQKSKPFTPELKKIENHPFYQNLVKYAIIPIWELERKAKKESRELVPDEDTLYHAHVSQYAIALFEALKRLHDIPYFMEHNPSLRNMENKNITPQEWFIYHYANFRVIATGILDTALLIANDVLLIGYEPKRVHRKEFLEREELIENKILFSLLKIDEVMEKYRIERNKFVHRSEKPDLEFVDNLNAYRFLKAAKEKGIYKGQLPKQAMVHAYFTEQRAVKTAEMRKDTVLIFEAIEEFLDRLNELYLEKMPKISDS